MDHQMVYLIVGAGKWAVWGWRMRVSVTEAKGQLTELVRRAEAGDEIILTRHGHAAVRLVPVTVVPDRQSRRALLEAARTSGAAKAKAGPNAARSQDFLYGDDGLPE
jgi:prevent-host-death family protein